MLFPTLQPISNYIAMVIDCRGSGQDPTRVSKDLGIQIGHLVFFPNEGVVIFRAIDAGKPRKGPRTTHNLIQLIDI